jgi:hypothetical protein
MIGVVQTLHADEPKIPRKIFAAAVDLGAREACRDLSVAFEPLPEADDVVAGKAKRFVEREHIGVRCAYL